MDHLYSSRARFSFSREGDRLSAGRRSGRRWQATRVRLRCRAGPVLCDYPWDLASIDREPPPCSEDVVGLFRPDSPIHLRYCTGAPATNPQSHSICFIIIKSYWNERKKRKWKTIMTKKENGWTKNHTH